MRLMYKIKIINIINKLESNKGRSLANIFLKKSYNNLGHFNLKLEKISKNLDLMYHEKIEELEELITYSLQICLEGSNNYINEEELEKGEIESLILCINECVMESFKKNSIELDIIEEIKSNICSSIIHCCNTAEIIEYCYFPLTPVIESLYNKLIRKKVKNSKKMVENIMNNILSYKKLNIECKKGRADKKGYKSWICKIKRSFILNTIAIMDHNKLPMVVSPLSWNYNSITRIPERGGYLSNDPLLLLDNVKFDYDLKNIDEKLYNLVLKYSNRYITRNIVEPSSSKNPIEILRFGNEEHINEINRLQRIPVKIIWENIIDFLDNISYEDYIKIFINDKIQYYDIVNENREYFEKTYNMINIEYKNKNIINKKPTIDLSSLNKIIMTLKFIYEYYINDENEELKLWYNHTKKNLYYVNTVDFRGREYINSTVGHMNNLLIRNCITLNEDTQLVLSNYAKFWIANQIKKVYNIEEGVKLYENTNHEENLINKLYLNFRNPMSYFNAIKRIALNKNFTINIDATASVIQISSLIIKDSILSYNTNIWVDSKFDDKNLRDPYELDISIDKLTQEEFKIFEKIINDRNLRKKIIMTCIYGSTPYEFMKKMQKNGELILFPLSTLVKIGYGILNSFYKKYPKIKIIKQLFYYIADYIYTNQLEINFKNKNFHTTFLPLKNKKVEIILTKEDKKMSCKINTHKNDHELRNLKNTLFPNFLHSVDSQILHNCRTTLLNNNVPTLGVHDCIICDYKHYEICLNVYNLELSKTLNLNIFDWLELDENEFIKYLKNKKNKKTLINFIEEIKNKTSYSVDNIIKSKYTLKP